MKSSSSCSSSGRSTSSSSTTPPSGQRFLHHYRCRSHVDLGINTIANHRRDLEQRAATPPAARDAARHLHRRLLPLGSVSYIITAVAATSTSASTPSPTLDEILNKEQQHHQQLGTQHVIFIDDSSLWAAVPTSSPLSQPRRPRHQHHRQPSTRS